MIAPVEPAMARPQGGTSFLERAAIVCVLFLFFLSGGGFWRTRAEGCWWWYLFGLRVLGVGVGVGSGEVMSKLLLLTRWKK
jgi:hypothetical protein